MGAGGGTPSRDSGRGITSSYSHPFNFRNKTGAIVEMTRQSAGESAQSPPIYVGLTHDLACNLDSGIVYASFPYHLNGVIVSKLK